MVYLCPQCHRGTDGVHGKNGKELNERLKREGQRKFEERYSRYTFMNIFGQNYLGGKYE